MSRRSWIGVAAVLVVVVVLGAITGEPELVAWAVFSVAGVIVTSTQIVLARRVVAQLERRNGAVLDEARAGRNVQVFIGVMQVVMVSIAVISVLGDESQLAQDAVVWGLVALPGLLTTLSLYFKYITDKGIEEARRRRQ